MNDLNYTAKKIAEICGGELKNDNGKSIKKVCIDNRKVEEGDLFVALIGENHDAHKFVSSSIEKGAVAVIVSSDDIGETGDASVIKVPDTLVALQKLAHAKREELDSLFVAVTGSNGKTTTRSMITHILSGFAKCSTTTGNLNNHIGLPLTILGIDSDSKYSVLEMGMNHPGEIRTLCSIASPDAAVISNVGPAHIGILGSLENIAKAKSEILEQLKPGSKAVLPGDSEYVELLKKVAANTDYSTFGEKEGNDYRITELDMKTDSISFSFVTPVGTKKVALNLAGHHNAFNAAAALAICHKIGCDIDKSIERLKSFVPVGARMERINRDGVEVLLDCYNANPASMQEALRYLSICSGKKIAVLGDMRELGTMSDELHRKLGQQAAASGLDLLGCVGESVKNTVDSAIDNGMNPNSVILVNSCEDTADLLKGQMKKGVTVLFKASRGLHFEKIVHALWPDLKMDLH
jgi:UDP-N-acetylmuramoyl-tripeptide--D-alanyl-D-alanine ligase